MQIKTYNVSNTPVHIIQTKQFKTMNIVLRFFDALDAKTVTARHLMLMMLIAKNTKFETRQALSRHLESLYDTHLHAQSMKLGKKHVNQVSLSFPNPSLVNNGLLDDVFSFLKTLLFNPQFDAKILREEKQFLKAYFKAEYSNKTRYAAKRYFEHLYKDHPYNINALGIEEAIDDVTLSDIEAAYHSMIHDNAMIFSVTGDVAASDVIPYIETLTFSDKRVPKDLFIKHDFKKTDDVKETMELSQDRLFIGLKSNVYYNDADYYALNVMNTLFGEGSDSLLFDKVREQNSLAYYVHSSYAPFSSLITVVSGMDSKNIDKGKALILETLKEIQDNQFSKEAFDLAKQQRISSIKKSFDNIRNLSVKGLRHILFDVPYGEKEALEAINNIRREDVIRVAKKCIPIFTYVLGSDHDAKN